jgi:hypothetical protein
MNLTDGFLHIKDAAKLVGLTVVSVRMHGDGEQYRAEVLIPLLIDPPADQDRVGETANELLRLLFERIQESCSVERKPLTQDICRVDRPPDLRTKRGPGRPRKAQSLG